MKERAQCAQHWGIYVGQMKKFRVDIHQTSYTYFFVTFFIKKSLKNWHFQFLIIRLEGLAKISHEKIITTFVYYYFSNFLKNLFLKNGAIHKKLFSV